MFGKTGESKPLNPMNRKMINAFKNLARLHRGELEGVERPVTLLANLAQTYVMKAEKEQMQF